MEEENPISKKDFNIQFNRRCNRYEIRLAETVTGITKEEVERKARRLLVAYHEAAKFLTSPIQIINKATVEECNFWQEKTEQLKSDINKLKTALKDCVITQNMSSFAEKQCAANRGRMLLEELRGN